MEPLESETVMSKELRIGMHVVFIDAHRKERDALLTAIHGDPQGRTSHSLRKDVRRLSSEEKESGKWRIDNNTPPIYAYQIDEEGNYLVEYGEPGENWPCVNLLVVSNNEEAQDQYGRQVDDRHTSVVHQGDSTAVGYCFRLADEKTNWEDMQPTIS